MAALRQDLLHEGALGRLDLHDLPQRAVGIVFALDRQHRRLDAPAFEPDVELAERGVQPNVVPLPERAVHVRPEESMPGLLIDLLDRIIDHGVILADTKYEFGQRNGDIVLMDEIHTPDSSRYFYADGFNERQSKGERQQQLSKEFVREWLIRNEFMGKEGQSVPEMSEEWVETISNRYIELYEKVTGSSFNPQQLSTEEIFQRIASTLQKYQQQ